MREVDSDIFPTNEPSARDHVPVSTLTSAILTTKFHLPLATSHSHLSPSNNVLEPLRTHIDAIVGEGHSARAILTDMYAIPRPVVNTMTHAVATRLYWKLLYIDIVRALQTHPSTQNSHPHFEARASVLFVHTQNGLGNRLRALASGLAIARATNRVPVVVWEKDAHLGSHLHDILHVDWLGSDIQTVLYKDLIVMDTFPTWSHVGRHAMHWHPVNYMLKDGPTAKTNTLMNFQMPSDLGSLKNPKPLLAQTLIAPASGADAQLRLTRRKHGEVASDVIDLKKHVYFKSAYVANALPKSLNSRQLLDQEMIGLTPSVGVRHIVQSINQTRLSTSYGVHVRSRMLKNDNIRVNRLCEYTRLGAMTTDYWRSRSQPSVFSDKMRETLRTNPSATFFVATDDVRVMQTLRKQFPGRIDSIERSCDGRDGSCVLYAMADLLCLSKTKGIFGSYWSSFSEAAGRLSGGKSLVLSGRDFGKEKPKVRPHWEAWMLTRLSTWWNRWLNFSDPFYAVCGTSGHAT